jgi:uncharacterized membrane protein (UPF0182 family)
VAEIVPEPPVSGEEEAEVGEEGETGEGTAPTPADPAVQALIVTANEHFTAAQTAQQNGDWSTYGQELEALQQTLQELMEATGEQPQTR